MVSDQTARVPCKSTWAAVSGGGELALGRDEELWCFSCSCRHRCPCLCMGKSWKRKSKREGIEERSCTDVNQSTHLMDRTDCNENNQITLDLHVCCSDCCTWLSENVCDEKLWLTQRFIPKSYVRTIAIILNKFARRQPSQICLSKFFYLKITIVRAGELSSLW